MNNHKNFKNTILACQDTDIIIKDIEGKCLSNLKAVKEAKELNLLKERCCSESTTVSIAALQGIFSLTEKNVLPRSQIVSMLISLLPSVKHINALISTIGKIVMMDFREQVIENKLYYWKDNKKNFFHSFILILKYSWEKTWFEIYFFIQHFLQSFENIKFECKLKFLGPIFHYVFWNPLLKGSEFQIKLFNLLLTESSNKEVIYFALEILSWLEIDIYYCLFLQDIFISLLNNKKSEFQLILSALTPTLAEAIKWLIFNGYSPVSFIPLLSKSIKIDSAAQSLVLFILADVIMETPMLYAENLLSICSDIINSKNCNKYVIFKFKAVALSWLANSSCLSQPIHKLFEDLLFFLENIDTVKYNDNTLKLINNEYFKICGNNSNNITLSLNLILISNKWIEKKELILSWLMNIKDSNDYKMLLKLYMYINGIILCENDSLILDSSLNILMTLANHNSCILISFLPILFYKLSKELDPKLQYYYLSILPRLGIEKTNVPLIISIIESLEKKDPKIMTPIIIQLYLSLWKFDKRIYSYLHKVLHDSSNKESSWELNVSKAKALKEICKSSPHLYAKDFISVLSKILNESSDSSSGLPTAIIIDTVTELCKTYIIDVSGTWSTLKPKLQLDKRPEVVISLCKFFGEIPLLNTFSKKHDQLILDIVPILWNYTFFENAEVVRNAFNALSKFQIESLEPKLLPELYRIRSATPKSPLSLKRRDSENAISPNYVPADCWLEFLEKIDARFIQSGGALITTLIERELNSLPRGIFYLPPEKSEPLTYSYLPINSICRNLVEHLRKEAKILNQVGSKFLYIKEIVRIISHEYPKLFPPLNWSFMSEFITIDAEFSRYTLTLLTKQASVSVSARAVLEDYLSEGNWSEEKVNVVLFLSSKLSYLSKGISFNIFQSLIKNIVYLCLESDLKNKSNNFFKVLLENLTEALKNKNISVQHKISVAKILENILKLIPPKHEIMKIYALCATTLPMASIENITSRKSLHEIDGDWLHRAIIIRSTIAMKPEIKNPLMWFNELIDASAYFPEEHNFMIYSVLSVIRSRRSSNFVQWYEELIKTIQNHTVNFKIPDLKEVILFFINILVTSTVVLSGCDCFFNDFSDVLSDNATKLLIFPQSLSILFSLSDWAVILPKVSLWLQHLIKWKELPETYVSVFTKSILGLKNVNENTFNFYINLQTLCK